MHRISRRGHRQTCHARLEEIRHCIACNECIARSRPARPVTGEAQVTDVRALRSGDVPVQAGQRVLVVAGEHHMEALSTADFLAGKGYRVEVLTPALYAGA